MGYQSAFFVTLTAAIVSIQLTQTFEIRVTYGSSENTETSSPNSEQIHFIQVSQILMKKEEKADTTITKEIIELQVLNKRLTDMEDRIRKVEQHLRIHEQNGLASSKKNDSNKNLLLEEQELGAETIKNLQTANTRINDTEELLRQVNTLQVVLQKELVKLGDFQIQLMTTMNELRKFLEPIWNETEQNMKTNQERFADDINVTTVQALHEEITSIGSTMNSFSDNFTQYIEALIESQKQDFANVITSVVENITRQISDLNNNNFPPLRNDFDKLLKGQETLEKNCNTLKQYGPEQGKNVTSLPQNSLRGIRNHGGNNNDLEKLLKNEIGWSGGKVFENESASSESAENDYVRATEQPDDLSRGT